jgi:tRNA(Ile)-lysidine synthase
LLALACARGPTHAAIIDHAIQPESAALAERAALIAQSLGAKVTVRRLAWPDGAPAQDQASARQARYAALADIARAMGETTLLTGHTRDDQAETVLIRWAAASGRRGLAGMAASGPYPLWPIGLGLTLQRPLLGASRQELRALLATRGQAWLDDPANDNVKFARVRARQILDQSPPLRERLWGLAGRAARRAARIDGDTLALAGRAVRFDTAGRAFLNAAAFAQACGAARARLLEVLLLAVSGAESAADRAKLSALATTLAQAGRHAGTLGGAAFSTQGHEIVFSVDPGRALGRKDTQIPPPKPIALNGPLAWQGRILIQPGDQNTPVEVVSAPLAARKGGDPHLPLVRAGGKEFPLEAARAQGLIHSWRALAAERLQSLLYRAAFTRP